MRNKYLALIGWLALTFSAAAGGAFVSVDGWYSTLARPVWNPPDWIFGPVWTTLYCLMAVAAWRVWQHGGWKAQRKPLLLYLVQWALNAAWTPLFFGLHRPGLAFAEIVPLALAVLATGVAFGKADRVAGILMLPYALWVSFAAFLNYTIWRLNAGA